MRVISLAGIVLLLIGSFILFRGLTYRTDRSVLKIGDFDAKIEERRTIPAWVGGVVILGGIAMIVASARASRT